MELAVAMVIIGLLVGGVLRGQELIENARTNALIKRVNEISAAIDTFQDIYRQRPGDAASATTRIPNCAAFNCENGDGNNLIASGPGEAHTWLSNVVGSAYGMETIQFWKHLAVAQLIKEIDPAADPASPAFGTTHMTSPFGGGFEMYFDSAMTVGAGNQVTAMHVLRLNGGLTGGRFGVIDTTIAQSIDTKMDDGDPNVGLVFADYGGRDTECKNLKAGGEPGSIYDIADRNNMCVMFFRMFNR